MTGSPWVVGDVLSVAYLRRRRAAASPCSGSGSGSAFPFPFDLWELGNDGWDDMMVGELGKGRELESWLSVVVHDGGTAETPMLLKNISAAMVCSTSSRLWETSSPD